MLTSIKIGTGAIAFREWKGRFYPKDLPPSQAFVYYAKTFSVLELNSTFYRIPSTSEAKKVAEQAPAHFPIAVKAPRFITHIKRLKDCQKQIDDFYRAIAGFGIRLGPILIQLPPNFKADLPRLKDFLSLLPDDKRIAVEFRHASWFNEPVYSLLKKRGVALVFNDTDMNKMPFVKTAHWGYLRLRRLAYTNRELSDWIKAIEKMKWRETFVIFKHEEKATAPALAQRFHQRLQARTIAAPGRTPTTNG